jgi:putative hydrolase of the HAD superfamily
MAQLYRAVIFDYGGVLSLPQDPAAEAEMASLCNLPLDIFGIEYNRERAALDLGKRTPIEYWKRILAVGGVTAESAERIASLDLRSWSRINRRMVLWALELRGAGVKTAVLSNMPQSMLDWMKEDRGFDWISGFSPRVFSCDVGLAKPQPEIFELCLEGLGIPREECLFIDDSAVNVEAAAGLGIRSLRFGDETQIAAFVQGSLPVESFRASWEK